MLMDPSLMQVDCQVQSAGEKLSTPTYDRKHTLSHDEYDWQGSDINPLNNVTGSNSVEPNNSSHMCIDEILDGSTADKSPVNMDDLPHGRQDEQRKGENGENPCFKDVKFQLTGCTLNNGSLHEDASFSKQSDGREDVNHPQEELHPPSNSQHDEGNSSFRQDIARTVVSRSCESNGDASSSRDKIITEELIEDAITDAQDKECPTDVSSSDIAVTVVSRSWEFNGDGSSSEDKKIREEQINGHAIIDAQNKEGGTDVSSSHAVQEGLHCTLQDLSEIACSIELVQGKSSPQEENETSISPNNTTDQLVHKNNCKGNNDDEGGESDPSGNAEQDHAIAFWVKWRGKWQTGIRCSKADCPLSTLKAKPTHERKSYIAVFFPRTRTYSWVDMLLVRPIEEYPVPLVNGTHRKWRKLVKDLSVPRRYIMQKLAIAMLNFSDELHTEAVVENARKATTWKEFALEASRCRDYSDLGKMLIKLHNMILPDYISCHWLQHSFESWSQRCKDAQNAETIEMLTEELRQSVLWRKVDELWNAPLQPELVPEWKTWKQEVMKWFFASHPVGNAGNVEQKNSDDDPGMELQTSRKRPKLEVHRGETYFLQMGDATCRILSEDPNRDNLSGNSLIHETIGETQTSGPSNIVTFPSNFGCQEIIESGSASAALQNVKPEIDSFKSSRQCSAFIEAKGRQCGRWANDGDIYCCVHLSMHSVDRFSREEKAFLAEAPMCSGMTNLGRKCKHRAQHGSIFCKKHRFQTSLDSVSSDNFLSSSESFLKRVDSAKKGAEKYSSSNAIRNIDSGWTGNSQVPMQEKLIPTVVGETSDEKNGVIENTQLCNALSTSLASTSLDMPLCIGYRYQENVVECQDYAKRHTLYCEKHLPKFLKRARNGKSRLISKDVFLNLLKSCSSRKQKICLHQACEFLYWFLRSNLSRQHSVLGSDYMQQILAEVSENPHVGEYLLKLVSSEREKLTNIWGFGKDRSTQIYSETKEGSVLVVHEKGIDSSIDLKCKICAQEFSDDHSLGLHWTDVHKREARWLFRGYACAICMDSFTNRKVLETHVQERHGVQFLQYSTLFRCMPCNSHFVNPEQLWQHVLSYHAKEFRLLDLPQRPKGQSVQRTEGSSNKSLYNNHNIEKDDGSQKFTCRFCGLRFDLLPDLGRHHQVAHMNPSSISHFPPGRGKYQLNRSRHYYSSFKKSLRPSGTLKKRSGFGIQKNLKIPGSELSMITASQTMEAEAVSLGKLLDFQCSDVAQALFSKIQKSRPHPSNFDILSIARSVCCRTSLLSALEVKYGTLPENFYLKAAKLCSEIGIQIDWHQEGFICPKGCKFRTTLYVLPPLQPLPVDFPEAPAPMMDPPNDGDMWEMEEYHYVLDSKHFGWKPKNDRVVLCEDVSFGRERVPIVCVVNVDAKDSLHIKPEELQQHGISVPWEGFNYVTKRLVDTSLVDSENALHGCACSEAQCSPEKCDRVNLFDNEYENAVDIHGKPMHGRFAYDERGRIILQEGYPIYECNSLCNCDASCQNKVLQKGLLVKLELFKTEQKGWAVRAAEPIPRGTFVCEYIGEVVKDDEAKTSAERCGNGGCSYLFDIDAHIDRERARTKGTTTYKIDATRYGNVSRFINHSCSPNLIAHLVLVESKDCQLAHVGLFASQDIAIGEELAYDYRQKLLPGDGCPCHCEAQNC